MNDILDYEPKQERKRSVWFSIFLWLLLFLYLSGMLFSALAPQLMQKGRSYPLWIIYCFAFLSACNIFFIFMVMRWKRWGYYAYLCEKATVFVIYFTFSTPLNTMIGEGIEIVLFTIFMLYHWQQFDMKE